MVTVQVVVPSIIGDDSWEEFYVDDEAGGYEAFRVDDAVLGSELNGDSGFDNPGSWTVTAGGWTVNSSKANCDGSQADVTMLFRSDVIPKNTTLRAEFTISNYVAGNVRIRYSMTEYTEYIQGNGKHILYYTTIGTDYDYSCLFADVNFEADVDDFSIKEVLSGGHEVFYTRSA